MSCFANGVPVLRNVSKQLTKTNSYSSINPGVAFIISTVSIKNRLLTEEYNGLCDEVKLFQSIVIHRHAAALILFIVRINITYNCTINLIKTFPVNVFKY